MSVVKRPGRSSVAFVVALTLLLAFVVPFVGTALAGHNTDHDLDCVEESAQNETGTEHTITCDVLGGGATNTEIDFEITGANDPDDGDTPNTPDFTCNTGVGTSCTMTGWGDVAAETAETGASTIRAFIDDNQSNSDNDNGLEADLTEGPNAGATDGGTPAPSGTVTPGSKTEEDDTDVMTKSWFADFDQDDATLDCTPETATNPATGANSTETYNCTLYDDTNDDNVQDAGEAGIPGITVDGEIESDVNDPDNGAGGTTADYNNLCTTDANGQCTFNIPAVDSQPGTTDICFWADPDADAEFDLGGDINDGGDCAEGQTATDNDQTDVVTKTWVAPNTPINLDAEPESDQNIQGTSHTVTATVTDINGAPVAGVEVDFEITSGRNVAQATVCDDFTTNASGQVTCSYTDDLAGLGAVTPPFEQDDILVCVDEGDDDACDNDVDATEGPDDVDVDTTDAVQKFWFATAPTVDDLTLDMQTDNSWETELNEPDGGFVGDGSCDSPGEATSSNTAGVIHRVCVTAFTSTDDEIPGQDVSVSLSGVGTFVSQAAYLAALADNDEQGDGDVATPGRDITAAEDLGSQVTITTDDSGEAFAYIYSDATGTSTLTASEDDGSDTGTKTWTAGDPRLLDCSPDSATNLLNTTHTVLCTVTDHLGNPKPHVFLVADEDGQGTMTNSNITLCADEGVPGDDCKYTDANGEAEFSTTAAAEGNETVNVEIAGVRDDEDGDDSDVGDTDPEASGDRDDECDLPAGETGSYADHSHNGNPDGTYDDTRADMAGICEETVSKTWSTTGPTPDEGFPRTVTLEASKNKVRYGKTFELTATVQPGDLNTPASCIQGVTVIFQRTVVGDSAINDVGTSVTDASGVATMDMAGDKNANYVAHLDQTGECSEANSTAEAVLVKKQVKLKISDQRVRRGQRVRFRVKVLPCGGTDGPGHPGDRALLYKTVGGQLAKIAAKRTNDNCVARFKRRVFRDATFQGRSPKQDADHQKGQSRKKAVQVRRR